jgi:adenylate kinase
MDLDVLSLDVGGRGDVFEILRIHVEGGGRPVNFLTPEAELVSRAQAVEEEREQAQAEMLKERDEQRWLEASKLAEAEAVRAAGRSRDVDLWRAEREKLTSMSMREYLLTFVVPDLTAALAEACRVGPEDPVEYVADYLLKRSENCN